MSLLCRYPMRILRVVGFRPGMDPTRLRFHFHFVVPINCIAAVFLNVMKRLQEACFGGDTSACLQSTRV